MSPHIRRPHIGSCPFCEQGQLGLAGCGYCHTVVAICDECELIWSDVRPLAQGAETRSSASYPHCPACQTPDARWYWLAPAQVRQAGLQDCVDAHAGGEPDRNST